MRDIFANLSTNSQAYIMVHGFSRHSGQTDRGLQKFVGCHRLQKAFKCARINHLCAKAPTIFGLRMCDRRHRYGLWICVDLNPWFTMIMSITLLRSKWRSCWSSAMGEKRSEKQRPTRLWSLNFVPYDRSVSTEMANRLVPTLFQHLTLKSLQQVT